MEAADYFCLADDGLLWKLGNHGDFDAADDTARSIGLNAIWIFDELTMQNWRETLNTWNQQEIRR